jgi:hypothetical protein
VRSAVSGERFGAAWLALREPYDTGAVAPDLFRRLAEWATTLPGLRVVDLGAGAGATLRRLGPILGEAQQWTLAELDADLVTAGKVRLGSELPRAAYWRLDLARDLEALGAKPVDLITASALLDLVSADWLARLVGLRARLGCALYVALTYNGRIEWDAGGPIRRAGVRCGKPAPKGRQMLWSGAWAGRGADARPDAGRWRRCEAERLAARARRPGDAAGADQGLCRRSGRASAACLGGATHSISAGPPVGADGGAPRPALSARRSVLIKPHHVNREPPQVRLRPFDRSDFEHFFVGSNAACA